MSIPLNAQEWRQVKVKKGISVFQQKQKTGLLKLKVTTETAGCINAFQAMLFDTKRAPHWLSNVKKVTLLDSPSAFEHFVHTELNAPWPVKDRDMVTYSRTVLVSNTQLQIGIQAAPDYLPKQTNYIRLHDVAASWIVTKTAEQRIHIEYQAIADPAGKLPKWLANSVAKSSAYKTFLNMKKELEHYTCN